MLPTVARIAALVGGVLVLLGLIGLLVDVLDVTGGAWLAARWVTLLVVGLVVAAVGYFLSDGRP